MKFTEEFKLIRSILFTYLTYFFSDILYKISVFLIENVSLKRNESFLSNEIINNLLTKMFFCAALVLLFIIKLRFPKGKNIHHIIEIRKYCIICKNSYFNKHLKQAAMHELNLKLIATKYPGPFPIAVVFYYRGYIPAWETKFNK